MPKPSDDGFLKLPQPGGINMIGVAFLICVSCVQGQELPRSDQFPDGISPSHVHARFELLERTLDRLMDSMQVEVSPEDFPFQIESDLEPMHVYQAVLTCTWRLQELDDRVGVKHIPIIAPQPREYHPNDVLFIVDLMLDNVREISRKLDIADLPTDETFVAGKSPTDVFNVGVKVFVKLNALCGYQELTPSEVFGQMVRATEDVKSMLRQLDPASRYYIDVAMPDPDNPADQKEPSDVFQLCLEIRQLINEKRKDVGLEQIPVPDLPTRRTIDPQDVFFQTQIIIAELNLLKKPLNTISSTPLAIPVTNKTPTHVYGQAEMVKYLLEQVSTR